MKIKKYILASLSLIATYLYQNKFVKKNSFKINNSKIPPSFRGFKIIQLSDIHCDKIGFSDQIFFDNIRKEKADLIFITGDILDSYRNNSATAYNILSQLVDMADCYFVSGNHELRLGDEYENLKKVLDKLGIKNISNRKVSLKRGNDKIIISGIEDFNYFLVDDYKNYYANHRNTLLANYDSGEFNILLAHRPEKLYIYSEVGFDLVFSGHAHGGQWNIPFVGRIFSPSQGFFPKYTHGIYKEKNTSMIVSQGLGNSSFPTRINNNLEYIVVELDNN
ncbi:metallophosphoesterase [Gemella sp. zg-570]|uniref:metallophosphoesterase n=1 Tax=Gemella sp. zg-570 TaxID=2840371 RepID=UPI001C0E1C66|nr:metallophosphoesterase [Gemella sp. zg-570]QWQ39086.1 metallophosphoesterase [Gemella sp. zg-570]